MTQLKFFRELASELDCDIEQLDDRAAEYVYGLYGSMGTKHNVLAIALAGRVYREALQDTVNP